MDRFPMLTTYQALLNGVAILLLVAGLFIAIGAARTPIGFGGETEFQFGTFLISIIPFAIGAFMIATFAELISLFLTIEERLYHIQYNTAPNNTTPKPSAPLRGPRKISADAKRSASSTAQPNATAKASGETVYPAASQATARKIRATVTTSDRTLIYQRPNKSAPIYRIAAFGEDVTLVARTEDCTWMKVDASYDGWIAAADLTLHGDFYALPVVSE